ncbi:AraC family transcriptional regulator [Gordonia westfalica]|uniref:AraC family transcriptional regulator n=1 Tax=Gordonia westfalica TaxID=158898 RepID=A0ABU2H026_9ACTN|nr:AraC family transcriptional regulator [Gordonia westfalica]MDS1116339.1 AraC family transcriptional regulator [Gordonia westfalica]
MFTPREDENRRLLRARDLIDRSYAEPLDTAALARAALMSPSHFIRRFRAVFGETPGHYLQRRRVERACTSLRTTTTPVTDVARSVGYESLGTFGRTFSGIIGCSPTAYRRRVAPLSVPGCFVRRWTRPVNPSGTDPLASLPASSDSGEAPLDAAVVSSGT